MVKAPLDTLVIIPPLRPLPPHQLRHSVGFTHCNPALAYGYGLEMLPTSGRACDTNATTLLVSLRRPNWESFRLLARPRRETNSVHTASLSGRFGLHICPCPCLLPPISPDRAAAGKLALPHLVNGLTFYAGSWHHWASWIHAILRSPSHRTAKGQCSNTPGRENKAR
jgi:hypothetical protein